MLIEGAGVVAHRSTPVPFFISFVMRNFLPIVLASLLFPACQQDPGHNPQPEPKGTEVTFVESDSIFANPERGLYVQIYYTSADLNSHASATTIIRNRETAAKLTLYLHS